MPPRNSSMLIAPPMSWSDSTGMFSAASRSTTARPAAPEPALWPTRWTRGRGAAVRCAFRCLMNAVTPGAGGVDRLRPRRRREAGVGLHLLPQPLDRPARDLEQPCRAASSAAGELAARTAGAPAGAEAEDEDRRRPRRSPRHDVDRVDVVLAPPVDHPVGDLDAPAPRRRARRGRTARGVACGCPARGVAQAVDVGRSSSRRRRRSGPGSLVALPLRVHPAAPAVTLTT